MKSLRAKLLVLILVSVLPGLAVVLYANYERRQADIERARADALLMVQSLGIEHENDIEALGRLLQTVSGLAALRGRHSDAGLFLRNILKDYPFLTNVIAADEKGRVYLSALPVREPSIKDRSYFLQTLKRGSLTAGEYLIGRLTGRPILPISYPIRDNAGRIRGVTAAYIDLEKYGRRFAALKAFPPRSTLNLLDRRFVRLYRYPDNELHAGKVDLPAMLKNLSSGQAEGVFTAEGVDGVKRIFAYRRFLLPGDETPYLYLRVGVPEDWALAGARRHFLRDTALLGGALLLSLLAAWIFADVLVMRRIGGLAEAAARLGKGDLSVRTGMADGGDEVAELARSFDAMAAALEEKEGERRRAEEELRQGRDRYRVYVENSFDAICRLEISGEPLDLSAPLEKQLDDLYERAVIGECNGVYARGFGYDDPREMTGLRLGQVYPRLSRQNVEQFQAFLENGCRLVGMEIKAVSRGGGVVYFLNNMYGQVEGGRLVRIWISLKDITTLREAQEELRRREEDLSRLIESLPAPIFIHVRGRIVFANPALVRLLKASAPEDVIGRRIVEVVPPELFDLVLERARLMEQEKINVPPLELNMSCLDGSTVTVVSSPIPFVFRSQAGVLTALHDITDRKRSEIELQKAHLLLQRNYLEIQKLKDELREQAIRDPLTGLYNRRYLDETMERELARAKRGGYPVSFVMVDIDRFKEINDTYGHNIGDVVLQRLAALLLSGIRTGDVACRFGGEEFLLVLPHASKEQAAKRAQGWRREFAALEIEHNGLTLRATVSMGVAAYPEDGGKADEVIYAADGAMYEAKRQGRNRVVLFAPRS